jgi:hypothetical protein
MTARPAVSFCIPERSQSNFSVEPSTALGVILASGLRQPNGATYDSLSKIFGTVFKVGAMVGAAVVGALVGDVDGDFEGLFVGFVVGLAVGLGVGASVLLGSIQ